MALPSSGAISMAQVATELGISSSGLSLDDSRVRALAGVAHGTISMSNLHGKSSVVKASVTIAKGFAGANNFPHPHVDGDVYGVAINSSARFYAMNWLAVPIPVPHWGIGATFGSISGTSALGNIVGFGCFDYYFYPPQDQNPQGGGYTLTLTFASAPANASITVKLGSQTHTLSKSNLGGQCYVKTLTAAEYNAFPKSGTYDLIVS